MTQLFREVIDMSLKNSKNIDKAPPLNLHTICDSCENTSNVRFLCRFKVFKRKLNPTIKNLFDLNLII